MKTTWLAGFVATGLLFAPLSSADDGKKAKPVAHRQAGDPDMQRAIAWEHWKDTAAAIQARKEARRPSVSYSNMGSNADREAAEGQGARIVKDPGEAPYKKHKQ